MKRFKWTIDFSFIKKEEDIPKDQKIYFEGSLLGALQNCNPQGIGLDMQRKLAKILDKFEATTDDYLELEDAQFEVIANAFRKGNFSPQLVKVMAQYYDNLDAAERP